MTAKNCARCRRTFYPKVESPTIALGWVCIDCRKDRERKDVLSDAKCPRDGSTDIEAIESSGNNYTLRCKHCGYVWNV
jgi:DNA-directed RNA polymerase subunit RPC12/RpoP